MGLDLTLSAVTPNDYMTVAKHFRKQCMASIYDKGVPSPSATYSKYTHKQFT